MRLRRLLALLLVLASVCGMLPMVQSASAAETTESVTGETAEATDSSLTIQSEVTQEYESAYSSVQVNPLYADVLDAADCADSHPTTASTYAAATASSYVSVSNAGKNMRSYLKNRDTSFTVYVYSTSSDYSSVFKQVLNTAMAHTGVPTEGDYLMWQWRSYSYYVYRSYTGSGYNYEFDVDFTYYTTAAQEQQMNTAVANLLNNLNLSGKSDYQKIKGVYDYVTANVDYDYAHLNDSSYYLQWTAYAALINGTSVCQGYANLMYRLLLELDVDIRLVAGDTSGGAHSWNIVNLGDVYYNIDATWDAGSSYYSWFLLNTWNFYDHYRWVEVNGHSYDFETFEFHNTYPMAAENYATNSNGTKDPYISGDYCGSNVYWRLGRDGSVNLFGSGSTYSASYESPWSYWADDITSVVVNDGITALGSYLFYDLYNVETVTLPSGITDIDSSCFAYCDNLETIYFRGSAPSWISSSAFSGVTATVYYPNTWSSSIVDDYGGDLTWVSYNPSSFILASPTKAVVKKGQDATFTVVAAGSGLTYQWQYRTSSSDSWKNTSATGCNTATLTVPGTTSRSGYQYRCKVTNSSGTVKYSGYATLYVLGITSNPSTVTEAPGGTATFKVSATGHSKTYQWYYRTSSSGSWAKTTATGYDTATLSVAVTSAKNGYQYRCKVTDSAGHYVYSTAATLKVDANALSITTQPTTQKVKAGNTATFKVVASGSGLSYQWQYRTSSSGSWNSCTATGNQTATMKVSATTGKSSYQYRCKITSSSGTVKYTNVVYLYVLGIKTQPTMQKVKAGATATFTVSATGHNKTYQWQYRTSSSGTWQNTSLSGNTTATLSVPGTTGRSGYQYRCKITDSAGNVVYTNAASLYVLGIKTQPTSQTVSAGSTATFTVTATGHNKTYQWQYRTSSSGTWKNATATGNQTATLKVSATSGKNGYQYRCVVTDSAGNVVYTNAVTLTVK